MTTSIYWFLGKYKGILLRKAGHSMESLFWGQFFNFFFFLFLTFSNEPTVSDLDLLNRCSYFNLQITGVNSTNRHMPKLHSPRVINLDKVKGSGIHWTCWVPFYFDKNTLCYFDSFGMLYPDEFEKRAHETILMWHIILLNIYSVFCLYIIASIFYINGLNR